MRHSWKDLHLYPWVELAMLHHAHDVALSYCKLRDSRWAVPIQVDTSTISIPSNASPTASYFLQFRNEQAERPPIWLLTAYRITAITPRSKTI